MNGCKLRTACILLLPSAAERAGAAFKPLQFLVASHLVPEENGGSRGTESWIPAPINMQIFPPLLYICRVSRLLPKLKPNETFFKKKKSEAPFSLL